MSSVPKLYNIEFMKFSRIMTARIAFQSVAFSPNNKQIDSSASFTTAGGFAIVRTSTSCCFLIDFTADDKKFSLVLEIKIYIRMLVNRNRIETSMREAVSYTLDLWRL